MPSVKGVFAFHPRAFRRETSSNFLGVPSGLVVSQTSSPLKPTVSRTISASSLGVAELLLHASRSLSRICGGLGRFLEILSRPLIFGAFFTGTVHLHWCLQSLSSLMPKYLNVKKINILRAGAVALSTSVPNG